MNVHMLLLCATWLLLRGSGGVTALEFSASSYTGGMLEGQAVGSSVSFPIPPHAEGGTGKIRYDLTGTHASKFSIDINAATIQLFVEFAESTVSPHLGNGSTDDLGMQATDEAGEVATVPIYVVLYATAVSALEGSLVVADIEYKSIMKVNLDDKKIRFILGTVSPNPVAVALDDMENALYWSDVSTGSLMRIPATQGYQPAEVFYQMQNGSVPDGLYIDAERSMLYYTDFVYNTIGSIHMTTGRHTVLHQLPEGSGLRAVEMDANREYLYFTDWGDMPAISRLSLRNGVAEVLLNESLKWPNALTIDNAIGRIYFCDGGLHVIEQANLDGSGRSTLFAKNGFHCYAMILKDNILYVSSWSERKVIQLNVATGVATDVHDTSLRKPSGLATSPGDTVMYFGATSYTAVIVERKVTLQPVVQVFGNRGTMTFSLEGQYSSYFSIDAQTGRMTAGILPHPSDRSPNWIDGDKHCFGSRTSYDLALTLQDSANEVARVVLIMCVSEEPTTLKPRPDPCTVNRGGCDQYCASQGDEVTCVCSDSFVLSSTDNKTCNDPCEADNGGCSQLCSVDSHQVVCKCHDGYTVDPKISTQCVEVDECEDNRCKNGGTCSDLVNMFICSCTPTWAGRYCTEKVVFEPVVENMSPLKGPVAGQSRLTLTGDHFVDGVLVRLGDEVCTFNSSGGTSAVVLTPPVNESYSNKPLPVSVHFPGFTRQTTPFMFTYKGNPMLSSVKPLESHTIGGTSLTVAGENLDVVSDPVLEVTMVHTYMERGNMMETVTSYSSACMVASSVVMSCLTPTVQVPDSFKNWDQNRTNRKRRSSDSVHSAGRRNGENKRYPRAVQQESDLTIRTRDEALVFYIGFRLDGVTTYKNLSDTKDLIDYGKVTYYSVEPTVEVSEFEPFVPNSGMTIRIQGDRFLNGFEASDYKVAIGGGWCNGVEMTANEIICAPPDELPAETTDSRKKRNVPAEEHDVDVPGSRKKRNAPAEKQDVGVPESRRKRSTSKVPVDVVVHAGTELKIYAGELTYHITEQVNLVLILGSVFVALAFIIFVAVFGCLVYKRNQPGN